MHAAAILSRIGGAHGGDHHVAVMAVAASKLLRACAQSLCWCILARHRASKVSESSGAHACESNGLSGLSTLVSSPLESGCVDASLGHSNNDFESMGLPSYQHFRPSTSRQDQYTCGFDGFAALHCCFACAVCIPIDESVAMQAAKAINGICFVISSTQGLLRCCNRLTATIKSGRSRISTNSSRIRSLFRGRGRRYS